MLTTNAKCVISHIHLWVLQVCDHTPPIQIHVLQALLSPLYIFLTLLI